METSKVLVVDDDTAVLHALRRTLAPLDTEVCLAENAEDAVRQIETHDFAVVISGHRLSGMSGVQLLRVVGNRLPESVRISITGNLDASALRESVNIAGARHLVTKPWDDDELRATVAQAIGEHRAVRSAREHSEKSTKALGAAIGEVKRLQRLADEQARDLRLLEKRVKEFHAGTRRAVDGAVEAIAAIVAMADPKSAKVASRCAELAAKVGQHLGLSGGEALEIDRATRLHAIGSLAGVLTGSTGSADSVAAACEVIARVDGLQKVAAIVAAINAKDFGSDSDLSLPIVHRVVAAVIAYDRAAYSEGGTGGVSDAQRVVAAVGAVPARSIGQDVVDAISACVGSTTENRDVPEEAVQASKQENKAQPVKRDIEIAKRATPAAPKTNSSRLSILVVDDDQMVCNSLRRDLVSAGYAVKAVTNGREALTCIGEQKFDAAIIDLTMPGLSGGELADRFSRICPGMPCVIVTGHATKSRILSLRGIKSIKGILVKPWDRSKLIAAIAKASAGASAA